MSKSETRDKDLIRLMMGVVRKRPCSRCCPGEQEEEERDGCGSRRSGCRGLSNFLPLLQLGVQGFDLGGVLVVKILSRSLCRSVRERSLRPVSVPCSAGGSSSDIALLSPPTPSSGVGSVRWSLGCCGLCTDMVVVVVRTACCWLRARAVWQSRGGRDWALRRAAIGA